MKTHYILNKNATLTPNSCDFFDFAILFAVLSSRFTQFVRRILGTDSAGVAFRMYGSINAENYCEPEEDSQWGEKLVRCTEAVFDLQQNIQTLLILLVTAMMTIFMSMRICLRG